MAGAAVLVLAFVVFGSPVHLDPRFYRVSLRGLEGLGRYAVGDYAGAARSYRDELRRSAQAGERVEADPALAALVKGDLASAAALAQAALARTPAAVAARLTLAEIALQRGQPDAALAALQGETGRPVEHFDALVLAAVAHARSGRPEPSIDLLNQALRSGYVEERPTTFLQALEVTGELARRRSAARPVGLLAHFHRYLRIFDSTQARPAIRHAKEAIARGDHPADAHLTRGVIYDKQGYPEDARAEFGHALELAPRHAEALRWSALLYRRRGDLANEYLAIKRAYEAQPADPYYLAYFGDLLVDRLGDIHQAKTVWERAVRERPRDARALGRLGEVEAFLGNQAAAVEHLEAALRLDPTNVRTQWQLGDALGRAGRRDDAIALLRQSVEAAPDSAWTHANLGMAYSGAGQQLAAIRELETAFRLGLQRVDYYQFLCELYFYERTIALERTAECFRRVLARDPRNARALRLLPEVEKNLALGGRRR
jgi:tetratricopeptide (TPR) repeat protein